MFGFLLFIVGWLIIGFVVSLIYIAMCFHAGRFKGDDIKAALGIMILGPIGFFVFIAVWLDTIKNKTLWERKPKDASK